MNHAYGTKLKGGEINANIPAKLKSSGANEGEANRDRRQSEVVELIEMSRGDRCEWILKYSRLRRHQG